MKLDINTLVFSVLNGHMSLEETVSSINNDRFGKLYTTRFFQKILIKDDTYFDECFKYMVDPDITNIKNVLVNLYLTKRPLADRLFTTLYEDNALTDDIILGVVGVCKDYIDKLLPYIEEHKASVYVIFSVMIHYPHLREFIWKHADTNNLFTISLLEDLDGDVNEHYNTLIKKELIKCRK